MEFMPELTEGSKIVFDNVRTTWSDITIGREYTIMGIDCDGEPYFVDDSLELNYAGWCYEFYHVVK